MQQEITDFLVVFVTMVGSGLACVLHDRWRQYSTRRWLMSLQPEPKSERQRAYDDFVAHGSDAVDLANGPRNIDRQFNAIVENI